MTAARPDDVDARPAATLVILRDSAEGVEVLLTTRPKHLRFMGGAAVFPGGATTESDRDPEWESLSARSAQDAAAALDEPDDFAALGAFVCALRESFEEVGLLLADGDVERITRSAAEDPALFLATCRTSGVRLRTDLLAPAGRWITPLGAPVRFDARFFLAEAPPGWIPDPDPREVDRCWWSTPAAALTALGAGKLLMAPPTIEMLQRLDGATSVEELRESLARAPVGRAGNIISVRLSPLVHVVLAPNPGVMTGPGTNTYVVGTGPCCVIDPAVDDPDYLDEIRAAAQEIAFILITHRHPDHIGGVAALAAEGGCRVMAFGSDAIDGVDVDPVGDGAVVVVGGATLRALHTPGHARDHLSLYLEGAASLFAGDNILGEGTAVIAPPEGNMRDYLRTLKRLRELHIDRIYPGHFKPLDGGRAVIDGYLRHREERRDAVMAALSEGASTVEDIVALVYRDTPAHLHPVAGYQVLSMLQMLEEDGIVAGSEGHWQPRGVE